MAKRYEINRAKKEVGMAARKYIVVPPMEGSLKNLREIAGNLWFSWNAEAVELFDHFDEQLWNDSNHNPLKVLVSLSRHELEALREDEGYKSHSERVYQRYRAYMERSGSYDHRLEQPVEFVTAYFSMEFGLAECLPLYSGGLGLQAGDHLKSASDLNLPMVGVGLLYQEGYFRQKLTADGRQQELYPRTDLDTLPLEKITDETGSPLLIPVDLGGETVKVRVLRADVGRAPLYLLDADVPENDAGLRRTTARLYGGDVEMRLRQELVLGIGGVRVLEALGIKPAVFHLNEGHAAFTILERIRSLVETEGLSVEEASDLVTSQTVLTLHRPGPDGSDRFERHLMSKYFKNVVQALEIAPDTFMGLGRVHPADASEGFLMPVLGLRMAARSTGISRLHASVAKVTWNDVWPHADPEDVPISAITNGIHIPSYTSRDLIRLYDRYLGPGWTEDPDSEKTWQRAEQIPDTELWRAHERGRMRLVSFARKRLHKQLNERGAPNGGPESVRSALDPEALTICCVSRFTDYQRATLLLRDPGRLAKIVQDPDRPVQFIFAGKAHPADEHAKGLIREIVEFTNADPFGPHMVFIEDYDIDVAAHMFQGADVWLSSSRRPMEACGMNGMKAAANGALNLSTLDGWWDEGYRGENGWAVGWGEEYDNHDYQDDVESKALYEILEESVKTIFYERSADDLPREWIRMMKRSIRTICPKFNSHRMVCDYVAQLYVPAARSFHELQKDGHGVLREMVAWKKKMELDWENISIKGVEVLDETNALKGKEVEVLVTLDTAGHGPEELRVELLHGPIDIWEKFKDRHVTPLTVKPAADRTDGNVVFSGRMPLSQAGLYGYAVRVTPDHPNLPFSRRFDLVHRG